MGVKEILELSKLRYFFSLPFVLIGYIHAHNQFIDKPSDSSWMSVDIVWILIAAVEARGLAMTLVVSLIVIWSRNPRTDDI